jgi:uncharacterized membrane protein YjgN (DUF898 family)
MNSSVIDLTEAWGSASEKSTSATVIEHRFEFSGDAKEYFRIWIVNLALSIVTLGVYSAWAKVRTQRYFYSNTRLAGATFDYQAQPLAILKGRAIALVLFGGYALAGQFSVKLQLGLAALIAVLAPWLIVRGAAFRARYSAWRGINFRFVPDYGEAYIRFLAIYIFLPLTMGLIYPFIKAKQKAFLVEHHRYGGVAFKFGAKPGQFYTPYILAAVAMFGWGLLSVMLMSALFSHMGPRDPDNPQMPIMMFAPVIFIYAGYFAVFAFLAAALANLIYNHIDVGGNRLRSTLVGARVLWIYFSNTLAILASVGLLIPWAMIRLARYRAECLTLLQAGDLDAFVASAQSDVGATGSEMDGLFDIDIGV